jgi:hypothetical protein
MVPKPPVLLVDEAETSAKQVGKTKQTVRVIPLALFVLETPT